MKLVTPLSRLLLVLMVAGGLGSLFGPQEPVLGIDIGSAGAMVFGLALWAGAWLFARNPDRIFSLEWSLSERRAWVGLLFVGLILLTFVRYLWALSLHEAPSTLAEMPAKHFGWMMSVLLIAWAVLANTIRGAARGEVAYDERDHRIERGAHLAGDAVLTFMVVTGITLLVALPSRHLDWWLAPLIAANVLIGVLICKTLAEQVWLVVSYARARR